MAVSIPLAEELAERLSAAGYTPTTTDHDDHVCVEIDVTPPVAEEPWRVLLDVLEAADRFGLVRDVNGMTVWFAVRKHPPRPAPPRTRRTATGS